MVSTAGAGRMAPSTSTRISARLKCVQGHSSHVNVHARNVGSGGMGYIAWIDIVVKSRRFVERRDFPPLWRSPLGPIQPDPTCFTRERGHEAEGVDDD